MFDPRSPYHRRRWHYDSDQPLSVAQLIAAGSLDTRTAALLWLLVQRHRSLIVSGPTDPTPGVGKTTTLNALLEFLPVGTTLVYTMGMYEDFDFLADTPPTTTCVLANEVSDHLPIYMWGRTARKLLTLPADGYAIATSCHADTLSDVLDMLHGDLRIKPDDVGRLGVVVNIGLVGRLWPPRRRFLSVNCLLPAADDTTATAAKSQPTTSRAPASTLDGRVQVLELATWNAADDTLIPASPQDLARLAKELGMTPDELNAAVERRMSCLDGLTSSQGAGLRATRQAIEELMLLEESETVSTPQDQSAP